MLASLMKNNDWKNIKNFLKKTHCEKWKKLNQVIQNLKNKTRRNILKFTGVGAGVGGFVKPESILKPEIIIKILEFS